MKKYLLLTLLLAAIATVSRAQPVNNSKWSVVDDNGALFGYFKFHYDTVSSSPDDITYTPESYFDYDGSNIILADFSGTLCSPADTGHYMVTTSNDTMIFVYLGDPCFMRQMFFVQYFFIRYSGTTGIETSAADQFVVSNPFDESILINNINGAFTFTLFDAAGRLLKEESFNSEVMIDASDIRSGIYYYRLKSSEGIRSGRLLKN
jgi:hypothetical protein